MERETVIARLRAHEAELKAAGVARLSLFGSVARGDNGPQSDVDVLVRLDEGAAKGGFDYFQRLDELHRRLVSILGCPVDLLTEPVRKPKLRQAIEAEAARAF